MMGRRKRRKKKVEMEVGERRFFRMDTTLLWCDRTGRDWIITDGRSRARDVTNAGENLDLSSVTLTPAENERDWSRWMYDSE